MRVHISKIFFLVFFALISFNVSAQQWSSEQQEVWTGVEKYWDAASQGNAQEYLSYFDESYLGWNNQSRVPQSKGNTEKWIENDLKNNSNVLYTITPLNIWVKDNFAFAHYTYAQLNKNNETGKTTPSAGIWTDILMKKNGKWVLIGDHGGRTSNPRNTATE